MVFKEGLGKLLGGLLLDDLQERVDDTLEDAKEKAIEIGERVIKKIIMMSLVLLGLLFGLVGIAWFLTAKIPAFSNGIGFVIMGLFIMILALIVSSQSQRKKK